MYEWINGYKIQEKKNENFFKNKNLKPPLEVYCNMVPTSSAPCNHGDTELSPGMRPLHERTRP